MSKNENNQSERGMKTSNCKSASQDKYTNSTGTNSASQETDKYKDSTKNQSKNSTNSNS